MTEISVPVGETTEISHDEKHLSVVEWQIHTIANPADDATLDGCGCGCACGCGCM